MPAMNVLKFHFFYHIFYSLNELFNSIFLTVCLFSGIFMNMITHNHWIYSKIK